MYYLFLIIGLFILFIFLSIFIDRFIISGSGFDYLSLLVFVNGFIIAAISLTIYILMNIFPNWFNTSVAGALIYYHSISFFIINLLFISITYIIFYIDSLLKKYNYFIFTRSNISYLNLLRNKRFLILSLGISYFLSTIIILFPIPQLISSVIGPGKSTFTFADSEIRNYQQLFVFASVPILFSLMKKK